MTRAALFFRDASQVLTLAAGSVPRRRKELGELSIIAGGAVLTQGPKILRVGSTRDLQAEARGLNAQPIDCRGRVVMPGFVDSHTHLIFAGSRVDEYEPRLRGASYEQIAQAGGGIRASAALLKETTPDDLGSQARRHLEQFAAHGTTTVEVKTGYGLDVAGELKSLEVLHRLRNSSQLELAPTLLAAHVLPAEFEGRRREFLDLVKRRLIPTAAKEKLAEFIDCFCDRGAFSVKECRAILAAGQRHGLIARLHADQLARTRATLLAVELGAASADHVDWLRGSDIRALASSNVIATLLPGPYFHLSLEHRTRARYLIDSGAAVALATDFNPGTSPTLNMQFILSLACGMLRLTPAEAVTAATLNAAYSLRRSDRLGSLEPGKQADLAVMDLSDYREIPYFFAWNHCVMTVKGGRIIYERN